MQNENRIWSAAWKRKGFLAAFIRETVMWIKRSFLWEAVENHGMW